MRVAGVLDPMCFNVMLLRWKVAAAAVNLLPITVSFGNHCINSGVLLI